MKQKFKLKVVNDATPSLKYYEGNYKEGLKVSTPEGRFRLTAEYGTNPILALNDPYYKGDTIAEVEKDKTTSVSISCKVANALTSVVFGELVPKRIAMRKSEKLALGISGLIGGISVIFSPIVWLLTASTNGVLRLIGIDPDPP